MTDIHSHILHRIDDGSSSLEESLEMVKKAFENGYRRISCTSHYRSGRYENQEYQERFLELSQALKTEKIHVELVFGNELYLDTEGLKALEDGKVNPLGKSRYILVEAFFGMTAVSLKKALKWVSDLGYKPILAHVERYPFLKLSDVREIRDMGVVLQINLDSMTNELKNRSKILLKEGLVHIVSTDAHGSLRRSYSDVDWCLKVLEEIVGKDMTELLSRINPGKILEDCQVEGGEYEEEKIDTTGFFSSFFGRFFGK
jgi:protein-tyrosine phosphatase